MTPTEKLLRELIALPSVNPAFLPGQPALTGEARVADFLADTARRAGLGVELQEVFPGRSNVLITLVPVARTTSRIILAPHMDTVGGNPPGKALFTPRKHQGRLHGRGACDTKGSISAMFSALLATARLKRRPQRTEIVLAALVDEEDAQSGSRALIRSGFEADFAIVGEPTELRVVTAHKGDLWLRVQTHGKAAHGARPELGRNAVHAMAKVVDALETDYAAELRRKTHPVLGRATVNVGSILGGRQPNIVPDECSISVDRRTLPGETERAVLQEIRALLQRKGLKADVHSTKGAPCLPLETDPRLPLVQQFLHHAGQSKPLGVDFFCDASVLASGGIPSVVFGPGDIAQAHTADEWISLKSLEGATRLLTRFLQTLP